MARIRALLIVQGEGRGHMTQALGIGAMLRRAGHEVCSAIVSQGGDGEIPHYFEQQIHAPVHYVPSGRFSIDDQTRTIDWADTFLSNSIRVGEFNRAFTTMRKCIKAHKPHVILNFYEPLTGLFMIGHIPRVPMVAIAHQFMFMHPVYQFPEGYALQKRSVQFFTSLTGLGATRRLALSLYDADPLPEKRLKVMPPLLRDELFKLPEVAEEPFYLVYLFHHSLAKDLVAWHRRHPDVEVRCFWNKPDADEITRMTDTLTFHRLHGERFLDMMSRCRGIVTTAGFESMAEAIYLRKPLMLNPVRRHFEQHCNSVDGSAMGAAIHSDDFDLGRLIDFVPRYCFDARTFRAWVHGAEEMFVREIELVARA